MKYITYYRVSTPRQGQSGLGLAAQQQRVAEFLKNPPPGVTTLPQVIFEFTEVETGTSKRERPALNSALAACRLYDATLVVATMDRLTRNAAFLHRLLDEKVPVAFADMPGAPKLLLGIMALVAEYEAEKVSERTKAALAAAKARGVKLGNPQTLQPGFRNGATEAGHRTQDHLRRKRAADLRPVFDEIIANNTVTGAPALPPMRLIARELEARGVPTARGGRWSPGAVKTVLKLQGRVA